MHDPGAVVGRHERVGENRKVARRAILRGEDRTPIGAVAAHELLAGQLLEHLRVLAEDGLHALERQH